MKRFLILSVLTAFLAITTISMAAGGNGGSGTGTIPSMTVQATSVHNVSTGSNNTSSVMTTQKFGFKKGTFQFAVFQNNTSGDAKKAMQFNSQMHFDGSASSTAAGKTTTLSNVFVNLSGLMLNAEKTKSTAVGGGAVYGTLSLTDESSTTQTLKFKGSFSLKAVLAGWKKSVGSQNSNPTSGTALFNMIISEVNSVNGQEPVVLKVTLPAISFKIVK